MTEFIIPKPTAMEVDINPSVMHPIPVEEDGALGDDERTETERSPQGEKKALPGEAKGSANGTLIPREVEGAKSPNNEADNSVNGRKKKHRRGKTKGGKNHRKWKPYNKLTWDERKELEERETRRAYQKREERFASGQPMAPYNTTQFLMEQHQPQDTDFSLDAAQDSRSRPSKGEGSGSVDSSEGDYYDSPDEEEIFLEKDFTEAYENFHAERLQTMSKDELVREYLEQETKIERLEKRLKDFGGEHAAGDPTVNHNNSSVSSTERLPSEDSVDIGQATNLDLQIRQLKEENIRLKRENERLRGCKNNVEIHG